MYARITLAVAALLTLGPVSAARAFEVKRSADGALVRWFQKDLKWSVDQSIREIEGGDEAIHAAIEAWSEQDGAPVISYAAESSALGPGFDRKNTISYAASGFEPAGKALAVTLLTFDDRTGEVLDADIVLNGKYRFAKLANEAAKIAEHSTSSIAKYDIGRVAAHEMGHALGLSDEFAIPNVLMYPFVSKSRVLSALPAPDDLAGLRTLYIGEVAELSAATKPEEGRGDEQTQAGCAVAGASHLRPDFGFAVGGLFLTLLGLGRARASRSRRRAAFLGLVVGAVGFSVTPDAGAFRSLSALSFTPSAAIPSDVEARVTGVRTTSVNGIFRSELDVVSSRRGRPIHFTRATLWGGTIGGIRQVIGGEHVPVEGEQITLATMRSLYERLGVSMLPDVGAARAWGVQ